MNQSKKIVLGLLLPVSILIAWYLWTRYGKVSSAILATPQDVWKIFSNRQSGTRLFEELIVSLGRVVKGFLLSAVLGIIVGSVIAISRTARAILLPTLTAIRQVPVIALIPLIILWAGIAEVQKVTVIVLAAFFPIMMNTYGGISETPESYLEVARIYKLSGFRTFFKVYLPHAMPQIFMGLQLGLGISWMAVVAAELISSSKGIGYYLGDARAVMGSNIMLACILVIGCVGTIMNYCVIFLFDHVTPWKQKEKKKILSQSLIKVHRKGGGSIE